MNINMVSKIKSKFYNNEEFILKLGKTCKAAKKVYNK